METTSATSAGQVTDRRSRRRTSSAARNRRRPSVGGTTRRTRPGHAASGSARRPEVNGACIAARQSVRRLEQRQVDGLAHRPVTVVVRMHRITSYNVCYTKLLRPHCFHG